MNREYIFRGFHPDENGSKTITLNGKKIIGEWVYGSLITQTKGKNSTELRGAWIVDYDKEIEVISETVGQYTGLTDKNGNRIFEGYIVQSEEYQAGDEIGVVVYDSKRCTYWVHSEKYDWWLMLDEADWEIIGNIYENAELLEVEQ